MRLIKYAEKHINRNTLSSLFHKLYLTAKSEAGSNVVAGLIIFLIVADFLSLFFEPLGSFGALAWVIGFMCIIAYALKELYKLVLKNVKTMSFSLLIFTLVAIITLIFTNIANPKSVNNQTSLDITCGLVHLEESQDYGFGKTCFFGYPARQFLIPATIANSFTPNLFILNLGIAVYAITALIVFAVGALKYLHHKENANIIVSFALIILLHIHFVNQSLFFFEQSVLPLLFGLMGVGFTLSYLGTKKSYYLAYIGLILYFLAFSFIPAIGLIIWFIGILWWIILKNHSKKTDIYLLSLYSITTVCAVIFSFIIRSDLGLLLSNMNLFSMFIDFWRGLTHLFLNTEGINGEFVSPMFHGIFLVSFILLLAYYKNKLLFYTGLWIAFIFVISMVLQGYTFQPISHRVQRAIVIFPALIFVYVYLSTHLPKLTNSVRYLALVIFFLYFITGFYYSANYLYERPSDSRYETIMEIKKLEAFSDKDYKRIIFVNSNQDRALSLLDYQTDYFMRHKEFVYHEKLDCNALTSYEKSSQQIIISTANQGRELCDKYSLLNAPVDTSSFRPVSIFAYQ